MESVYSWLRSLTCYYLLSSIVMNLVPKKEYQVYVKSFMGMLLVVIVMTPVLSFFRSGFDLSQVFVQEELQRQWEDLKRQGLDFQRETDDQFLTACQNEIAVQIRTLCDRLGCPVKEVDVTLGRTEELEVKKIAVTLQGGGRQEANILRSRLMESYGIGKEHINIDIR